MDGEVGGEAHGARVAARRRARRRLRGGGRGPQRGGLVAGEVQKRDQTSSAVLADVRVIGPLLLVEFLLGREEVEAADASDLDTQRSIA